MVFTPDNYFAIWDILSYELFGSEMLVFIFGLVVIAFFSAKFMIPFQVTIVMLSLWFLIISAIMGNFAMWMFIILMIGTFFYWVMARMIRRN